MPHLKRLVWLLAWSVWIYLGFGLHRELPRDLGPVVCRLPLQTGEKFQGFLRGREAVATSQFDRTTGIAVFRLRDPWTGAVERETAVASAPSTLWTYTILTTHGFAVGYEQPTVVGGSGRIDLANLTGKVILVNLSTGERNDLAALGTLTAAHPLRPWAIFCRGDENGNEHMVMLDLETRRTLLKQIRPTIAFALGWPTHFFGADHYSIPMLDGETGYRLEVRSIQSGRTVKVFDKPGMFATASSDDKVAWYDGRDLVVESLAGDVWRLVDKAPADAKPENRVHGPRFSSDGRTVLSPGTGALIDLASGRHIWEAADHERATDAVPPDGFHVFETWKFGSGDWSKSYGTFAVRSMNDGSFVCRTWMSIAYPANDARTLFSRDGIIHELPPRVNWPLLAFCQTILALPLVLLWVVLRWRRKHKQSA